MDVMDRDDPIVDGAGSEGPQSRADDPRADDPTLGETVLVRQIRYFVAICSFSAGVLHILAMVDHRAEPTVARAFLAVAAIQIVWGVLLIVEPRRLYVLIGSLATAAAIAAWVFSRTKGISWFPGLESVESLGWKDVVTQFFQLLALAGSVVLLLPASVHQPAGKKIETTPIAIMALLAMLTLAVLYSATHGVGHSH
jgi:hypothetical protein